MNKYESEAQDPGVSLLEIEFPPKDNFMNTVRGYLDSIGYDQPTIVARFFNPERLDVACATGVDRDSGSMEWPDVTPVNGVTPDMGDVFYAFTWQFRDDWPDMAFEVDINGRLTNVYFDYHKSFHYCVALYDSSQVVRKDQFEYQFQNPKEKKHALLAIAIL